MGLALINGLLAIADVIGKGPVLYIAATEQSAERLSRLARAAFSDVNVLFCPAPDAIPGEVAPSSAANVGARVAALRGLAVASNETSVLIAPPSTFTAKPPEVNVGAKVDLEALQQELLAVGYHIDERIDEPGEVGVPGSVLDVFPADADRPVRIEAEEGRIRSIRSFDPISQRSRGEIEHLALGRATEPEFGDAGVSLLSHIPDAVVFVEADAAARRERTVRQIVSLQNRKRRLDPKHFVDLTAWERELATRSVMTPQAFPAVPRFITERQPSRAFARFLDEQRQDKKSVLIAGSERDTRFLSRRLARDMKREGMVHRDLRTALAEKDALAFVTIPLDSGASTEDVAIVAAADLMGGRADRDDHFSVSIGRDLLNAELRLGDAVVHEDHGVAVLKGLRVLETPDGGSSETIELEYAKGGIRQVPLADAAKLWRYGGEPDAVRLDTLDGKSWAKRRPAIDAAIVETGRAIRALAREKAKAEAPVLEIPAADMERFVEGFPFQETADQWKAFEAARSDLNSGKPMDRLVVGDVGFGKTEVALRAAAQAVLAGKQVALIAPTTLLARQHFETFGQRFKSVGIEVAMLSRLTSTASIKTTKAGLADGTLRLVVGTSALASPSVTFKDLALVIIDEEQRFGGAQKDKLARMGAGHVMRLSATPIPRTLQTALIGLNEISVIATPPARRMPVRTSLGIFDEATIRAALLREHGRSGQSFVVVPRIEDVDGTQAILARLVPGLTVVTVHGKMKGEEAEAALMAFARGDGDVLLATSIIETGLDVPRANTMIVLDAQRFGIGQLHQLRGRVGRSSRRAALLLMTPADQELPNRTRTRLQHMSALDSLGAGFAVSARDLDMRGAGDLVSNDQSGHMKLVGIELYQHLLTYVLRELAGETPPSQLPRIEGAAGGCFPAEWIVDADLRIAAYIRLARAASADDLDMLCDELEDRYGALPNAAATLIEDRRMGLRARALGIERVQVGPGGIALTPVKGTKLPDAAPLEINGDRWLLKFDPVSEAAARAKAGDLLEEMLALLTTEASWSLDTRECW